MRWIRDVGATFVQLDSDSDLVALTVAERVSSSRHLRRAQVLAGETSSGLELLADLMRSKLVEQAKLAGELVEHRPSKSGRDRRSRDPQGSILDQLKAVEAAETMGELRAAESVAGRCYWNCFAWVPIRFDRACRARVPEHWHQAGPRTSSRDRKRAKKAVTPAHAILNYLYAILQTEATIAAQRMGFDQRSVSCTPTSDIDPRWPRT